MEVWRDSFGLFGAADLVDGMTDSIASATCFRSSDVRGEESLCLAGSEGVQESLFWRLGLESCERMDKSIMAAAAPRYILGERGGDEGVKEKD